MLKKFFGNAQFYKKVFIVVIPIIIQNFITQFVAMLDNIMVGQTGTIQMSAVSIVNQLLFVFNLCCFGAVSGAGIFTAQYYGKGDMDGVRYTHRFKVLVCVIIAVLGITVLALLDSPLISLFLQGDGSVTDIDGTTSYAKKYLFIMLFGLPPFAIASAYADTLRSSKQTLVPMIASVSAVLVNLVLNYILIFGKLGAPEMGVEGAAIATVVSRYVEMAIVVGWTHFNPKKNPYIVGMYKSLRIPKVILKQMIFKGLPLLLNEAVWAGGVAMLSQCYSTRGLTVVAAQSISSTMFNLSSVVYMSMGIAVGIIIGQMLGSGESNEKVRDTDRKLITLSVLSCTVFAGIMAGLSSLFPLIYNTSTDVRELATIMICITAGYMPINAFAHSTYFTIRSGGKSAITFIFDSGFKCIITLPIALILTYATSMPIIPLYAICLGTDLFKCVIGFIFVKSNMWLKNLTTTVENTAKNQ
ncbi:MAG: MATE family efflux transporter [Clostridiales bacterium]|nr:MATE family efflux transporter [Clostridiales bacterium]